MIFIRPYLLLLLFIPFLFKIAKSYAPTKNPWTKWVDAKLLPFLLFKSNNKLTSGLWKKGLIFLWSFFVIASAGPAFEKLPTPVSTSLPNTVIIFDLGPTMQEASLTSAKIKLHDLLTALAGNRVGLVLYADKGYTAMPLTQDRSLVRALISTLHPSVLPNTQQNLSKAFQQAERLIQQTGGKGRIIFITSGGVDGRNIKTSYPVGVLGIDDKAISPTLKNLGTYRSKTVDASDILSILKATEPNTTVQFNTEETTDTWADLAAPLTLILLPFFAFTFRKGFLFLLVFSFIKPAYASFFLREDQEAYAIHQEAVQNYRDGNYEKAVQGFQNHPYNQGNALAFSGKIKEAIQAYSKELSQNPDNEDARFNKEYLEKQLPPPEEQQQNTSDKQSGNNVQDKQEISQNKEDQHSEESKQSQNQLSSEKQSEKEQNEQQNSTQPNTSEEESQQIQPLEIDENNREQSPFNQEQQQILNRLDSDPYRVLRYRLLQQARKK